MALATGETFVRVGMGMLALSFRQRRVEDASLLIRLLHLRPPFVGMLQWVPVRPDQNRWTPLHIVLGVRAFGEVGGGG